MKKTDDFSESRGEIIFLFQIGYPLAKKIFSLIFHFSVRELFSASGG